MAKKVGVPRGLFYYQYFPLWRTFLEELGAEIIVSDYSTKRILNDGVKASVDEACLPVKLFHGHVLDIKDRVDYLFIPRFTSISRDEYICPKFGGLPDVIRHSINNLPQIIDTEVNLRKSGRNSWKAAFEVGRNFTCDKKLIKKAYLKALEEYRAFRKQVKSGILPCDILDKRRKPVQPAKGKKLKIMVIGHVYNLYDSFVNMDMINKLRSSNVVVTTVDMIDDRIINTKAGALQKKMFWNFGRKAAGSAFHMLDSADVDGIIYIMSFGCGVDSFVCDLIERKIRSESDIPFIIVTIDEHSGEAGINTRLEAFVDMIRWRKKNETDISAYG